MKSVVNFLFFCPHLSASNVASYGTNSVGGTPTGAVETTALPKGSLPHREVAGAADQCYVLRVANLIEKECAPCKGGAVPLHGGELARLSEELGGGWRVINGHHLEREFKFDNFRQALDFTNCVGGLAETQNHHPDIFLSWGKVKLTLWTHKIDGLTESDFIFAAKVNLLAAS